MSYQQIRTKWENFILTHENFFCDDIETWKCKFNIFQTYVINYNKIPSSHDTFDNIAKLGNWYFNTNKSHKSIVGVMKNSEVYDIWKNFLENYKELTMSSEERWVFHLDKLIEYININKKLPSKRDANSEIKFKGSWLSDQKKIFKNKTKIMKNKEIYNRFEIFLQDYGMYFK